MSHFQVMPECFADTLLVNMLGFTKANHQNFLNTLMQKNAPGFVQLRAWICECAWIEEEDI